MILTDLLALDIGPPSWDYWSLRRQPEQWLADIVLASSIRRSIQNDMAEKAAER